MESALVPAILNVSSGSASISWLSWFPLQILSGDFLYLAIVFLVLAIIAAVVGARGVAGLSMEIAKWLVIIFIVLAIVSFFL